MPDTFVQHGTTYGYGAGFAYCRRGSVGVVRSLDKDAVRWHAIHSVGAERIMAVLPGFSERAGIPGMTAFVRFD